jgi:hypothetical protein
MSKKACDNCKKYLDQSGDHPHRDCHKCKRGWNGKTEKVDYWESPEDYTCCPTCHGSGEVKK